MVMVILTVLLLSLLFVIGLFNTLYHYNLPHKKIVTWFNSKFLTTSSADTAVVTTSVVAGKAVEPSDGKKEELKRVFATFDKNGDGFITKEELRQSLKGIGIMMKEEEVEEMVVKLDGNGDGLIDVSEFCGLFGSMVRNGEEEEREVELMREAFDVFDGDGDGVISVEELGLVLSSLGLKEGKRLEACKDMIKKVDLDGDGMVNFDEFKSMLKNGGTLTSIF